MVGLLVPVVPYFSFHPMQGPALVVSVSSPFSELVKVAARMRNVRVGVVAARIFIVPRAVRRHIARTHDILPDLIDTVACQFIGKSLSVIST